MLARARPGVAAAGAGEAGPCQGPLPAAPLAPAQQSQVSRDAVHSPPHPAPRPVSPPSPCQQLRPYLGWRSQEKLPTFMEPGARLDTLDQACSDLLHTA